MKKGVMLGLVLLVVILASAYYFLNSGVMFSPLGANRIAVEQQIFGSIGPDGGGGTVEGDCTPGWRCQGSIGRLYVGNNCKLEKYQRCPYNDCEQGCRQPPEPKPEPNEICTDSDGGLNYEVYGITSNSIMEGYDFCYGGELHEWYCDNAAVSEATIICPNGCFNGECKQDTSSCYDLPAGAVSWWSGGEWGDVLLYDLLDGNDGTGYPSIRRTLETVVGSYALEFSGNNFIKIPYSDNLNFTKITIEAWVNPSEIREGFVAVQDGTTIYQSGQPYFMKMEDDGRILCSFRTNLGVSVSSSSIGVNQWTHVACTYDGAGTAKVYINGNLAAVSSNPDSAFLLTNDLPIYFGRGRPVDPFSEPYAFFKGKIDELTLYDRALDEAEIQGIYNARNSGKCVPVYSCVTPPEGLVSWWDGTTTPAGGMSYDISDGNDGTNMNVGAGFITANGKVGSTFNFDGVDDYIEVPDADNLDVSSITIEGWIKPNARSENGKWSQIIYKGGSYWAQQSYGVDIDSTGLVYCWFKPLESSTIIFFVPIRTAPVNEWTHVACTYDEVSGARKGYYNGILSFSNTNGSSHGILPNNDAVFIGGSSYTNESLSFRYSFFNGSIDELSIYNRALTDVEIQTIYNAGSEGKCK